MRVASTISLLLLMAAASTACYLQATYEDVSEETIYKDLIGTEFRTRSALLIFGITLDRNYNPPIDYYEIMGKPGIGGPEVLLQAELSAGAILRVIKVWKCTNCYLDYNVRIEVAVSPDFVETGAPIYLTDGGNILETNRDEGIILSSEFFEPISS